MATLPELLARDLLAWASRAPDGVPRKVVLWLDPGREFARLWPQVTPPLEAEGVSTFRCGSGENGQLALKLSLLRLEADSGSRAIVYLPGFSPEAVHLTPDGSAPELWSVYEYRFKGCVWGVGEEWEPGAVPAPPTLAKWLQLHGMRVAEEKTLERLAEGGQDSLLARYAELRKDHPPSEWLRPVRESDVLQALGGDPRDALRDMIAAANNAVRIWGDEKSLVIAGIEARYGLKPPAEEPGPEALADAFIVQLALIEAWDAFGRPTDFPFRARLPERGDQRDRAVQFLRTDVLQDMELGPRYRDRMARLEKDYDLHGWASGRPGQPRGLPLLARKRWLDFLQRFDSMAKEDWRAACRLLAEAREQIGAGRATPWDRLAADTQWLVLDAVASLWQLAQEAIEEAQELDRVGEVVSRYAERWWRIDRLHLHVRAACSQVTGLENVRRVADLAYFEYAEAVNDRFVGLVETEGAWPPAGTVTVESVRRGLWTVGRGRKGVIVTDALRWDLACSLRESLAVEFSHVLATLPTTTPFGMTALLPFEEALEVAFMPGVSIKVAESGNLAAREARKALLEAKVTKSDGKPAVGFIDMQDVLKGVSIPPAPIVVVFDNTIDEQGHKGTEELPGLAEQFISKLRRTIERLHESGAAEVHVVTDHGFLLLPADMVNNLGKPSVPPIAVLRKESRWAALKPEAPVTGLIRLPLPLAPEVTLGFPRGVRTLTVTEDFVHGGISLQEAVIPHVVSRAALGPTRPEVQVSVTSERLFGGTVPVILRPSLVGQASLGEIRPVTVVLWVDTVPPGRKQPIRVTEPVEAHVRPDVEELKPAIYLKEGFSLQAGQELTLRAVETETGQDLANLRVTLGVDWE